MRTHQIHQICHYQLIVDPWWKPVAVCRSQVHQGWWKHHVGVLIVLWIQVSIWSERDGTQSHLQIVFTRSTWDSTIGPDISPPSSSSSLSLLLEVVGTGSTGGGGGWGSWFNPFARPRYSGSKNCPNEWLFCLIYYVIRFYPNWVNVDLFESQHGIL